MPSRRTRLKLQESVLYHGRDGQIIMNAKPDFSTRKITPLFQSLTPIEPLEEETMLRFLDEPDESDSKRSFLNQCALSDEALVEWDTLNQILEAGKELPMHKPDPAIRSSILDAAYAATLRSGRKGASTIRSSGLPGWRWAWAALFLALLWSGYQEFQSAKQAVYSASMIDDALDAELLTLDDELNQLQTDLGIDLNASLEGSA